MADGTPIEWTDATWNPVRGCTRISAGCGGPNHRGGCYAETIAARFSGPGQPFEGLAERTPHGGRWTGKLAAAPDETLTQPLRWKRPRRIFVNSMSDLFHEALPDETIDRVFAVMALCPQHTFQVLTKRAARMRRYMTADDGFGRWGYIEHHARKLAKVPNGKTLAHYGGSCLPNVWLGVSTEDQATADERIPHLLATPAAKRFISAEPLLGAIDLACVPWPEGWERPIDDLSDGISPLRFNRARIDWVIAGGESGPRARPMHPDWARSLRDQCAEANVPFFFKQWGEWAPDFHRHIEIVDTSNEGTYWPDGTIGPGHASRKGGYGKGMCRVGKAAAGAELDGKIHREFPT